MTEREKMLSGELYDPTDEEGMVYRERQFGICGGEYLCVLYVTGLKKLELATTHFL